MATTIQLNEDAKRALDRLKSGRETYEEVILNLMETVENMKREKKNILIEGYKEMADESIKISREWEGSLKDGLDDEDW
ncbi:MAG: hypothetical protein Q8P81_02625 [Nanoarchaeota archaeon]|nr:hypothetical protein [Nanoarchaeota archaeon]